MKYKLRFVQKFKQEYAREYLELEKQFAAFEAEYPGAPAGKRFLAYCGRDASDTLIWECEFDTLEEVYKAQHFFLTDSRHEELYQEQARYIVKTYTEIYRPFE